MTVGVAALHPDAAANTRSTETASTTTRSCGVALTPNADILNTRRRRRRRRAELLFTFADVGPGELPGNIGERWTRTTWPLVPDTAPRFSTSTNRSRRTAARRHVRQHLGTRASNPPFRATIVIFSRHRLKPFVTRWRHVAIRISCRVYALVKYDPLIQEGLVGVVRKWLERRSGSKGRRCDFRQLVT